MITHLRTILASSALSLLTCACSATREHQVFVDAFARSDALSNRAFVLEAAPGIDAQGFLFEEFRRYAEDALASRGFEPAHDPANAALVVRLGFDAGPAQQREYSYSVPIWGETGFATQTTHGKLDPSTGQFHATTHFYPSYGVVGTSQERGSVTLFPLHVLLQGFAADSGPESRARPLFETHALTWFESDDLRAAMPVLMLAARDWIGVNSGERLAIAIPVDDPRLAELRSGTARPPSP